MKEQCSCGSQVSGRHKWVVEWRATHTCPIADAMMLPEAEPEEPEMQGSHSQAERAGDRTFEHGERSHYADMPIVNARMGFVPNPPVEKEQ